MGTNLALNAAGNVADYLLETGLFAKAIEFYEECFVLLRICITSGLERLIQRRPREVERQLYMGLANAYSQTGNPKKAKELCENVSRSTKTPGSKEENLIAMNLSVECTSILANVRNH